MSDPTPQDVMTAAFHRAAVESAPHAQALVAAINRQFAEGAVHARAIVAPAWQAWDAQHIALKQTLDKR